MAHNIKNKNNHTFVLRLPRAGEHSRSIEHVEKSLHAKYGEFSSNIRRVMAKIRLEFLNFYIIIRFKILLIDYLNELIDFSMSFPFYRRLNPLFDELFNKDTTLSIGRSIFCARAGWGPPARGDPRARKNASTN